MKRTLSVVVGLMVVAGAQAVSITHSNTTINMEFVNIGYVGNVADSTGYGAVDYDYRIGTYEVTIAQFETVRAADSRIGNGNEDWWNDDTRSVGTGAPASCASWFEAAMFCNWLTTGDAYTGAYQFNDSGTLMAVNRNAAVASYGTVYVLPNVDEWYKAAYYKPIHDGSYSLYASGLNTTPIHGSSSGWNYYNNGYVNGSPNWTWETGFGAEEQNGTYDMMGNVWEWNESAADGTLDDMEEDRVVCGGAFGDNRNILSSSYRTSDDPTVEYLYIGFHVVAIPEPSSLAMIGLVGGCAVFIRRRFIR